MGLAIWALKQVELIDVCDDVDEWEEKHDAFNTYYAYPVLFEKRTDFHEWTQGLTPGGVYAYEDQYSFRAGSYSWYNYWRADLSRLALGVEPRTVWNDPDKYQSKPFFRLINFSDCEGIIGPEFCVELALDFVEWQARADEWEDEWWQKQYGKWRTAFEFAATNGLVDFH